MTLRTVYYKTKLIKRPNGVYVHNDRLCLSSALAMLINTRALSTAHQTYRLQCPARAGRRRVSAPPGLFLVFAWSIVRMWSMITWGLWCGVDGI